MYFVQISINQSLSIEQNYFRTQICRLNKAEIS